MSGWMESAPKPDGFRPDQPNAFLAWLIGSTTFDGAHPVTGLKRKIAKRYLRVTGHSFNVNFKGLNLLLSPAKNADDMWLVMHGRHPEMDELDLFVEEVRKHDCFVDVGGNAGIYALLADQHMPEGSIITFEPDPEIAAQLETNLSLNDAERVTLVRSAVGAGEGVLTLYKPNRFNAGQNSARKAVGGNFSKSIEVPVTTLPKALAERGISKIGMLKVDIEGYEDQAVLPFFRGAPAESWPDYIMLETCHRANWEEDLEAEMTQLGYAEVFRNANNAHFSRKAGSA